MKGSTKKYTAPLPNRWCVVWRLVRSLLCHFGEGAWGFGLVARTGPLRPNVFIGGAHLGHPLTRLEVSGILGQSTPCPPLRATRGILLLVPATATLLPACWCDGFFEVPVQFDADSVWSTYSYVEQGPPCELREAAWLRLWSTAAWLRKGWFSRGARMLKGSTGS